MQEDKLNEKNNENSIIESGEKTVKQVDDNNIVDANGGYVFNAGRYAGDKTKPYEVIDDANGKVLGRYSTKDKATSAARTKRQSTDEIKSWTELYRLRNTDK